jgi:hypothetical protein
MWKATRTGAPLASARTTRRGHRPWHVRKLLAREPEVPRPASSARSARCSGPHREGAEHLRADHGLRPGDGLGLDLAILEHRLDDEIDRGDVGAILGFGYAPYTGGPLSWIDMMGAKSFVELCNALEKHGPRFKPTKLLVDMAATGDTFYRRAARPRSRAPLLIGQRELRSVSPRMQRGQPLYTVGSGSVCGLRQPFVQPSVRYAGDNRGKMMRAKSF